MPDIANAILGVTDHVRVQQKAKRLVQADIANLPNWAKNWTPQQMHDYVETQLDGITDLASAKTILKVILPKMAWMDGMLRDFMLLKQEES